MAKGKRGGAVIGSIQQLAASLRKHLGLKSMTIVVDRETGERAVQEFYRCADELQRVRHVDPPQVPELRDFKQVLVGEDRLAWSNDNKNDWLFAAMAKLGLYALLHHPHFFPAKETWKLFNYGQKGQAAAAEVSDRLTGFFVILGWRFALNYRKAQASRISPLDGLRIPTN